VGKRVLLGGCGACGERLWRALGAAAQGLNPVAIYNNGRAFYQKVYACGLGKTLSGMGNAIVHEYTDWLTTDDPRRFGQSFGNVLIAVGGSLATKTTGVGSTLHNRSAKPKIKLDNGMTDLGYYDPQNNTISLNRAAIRQEAKQLGIEWKQDVREIYFHERFHQVTVPFEKLIARITGKDLYNTNSAYRNMIENAADLAGRLGASIRNKKRPL
jgi:hypothetical protein